MLTIVLATANLGKVGEITPVLSHVAELVPRPAHVGDVVEDAGTLVGNARLKAAALAEATGLPALADDTGVFVDALPDELGVEAAHYGGDHLPYQEKNALLLRALEGVPAERRTARFETVALLRWPGGTHELVAVGDVTGRIVTEPRGDEGWGFDPVFAPDEGDGRTFAELGDAVKRTMSHRGRAFRRMAWLLGDGTGTVLRPARVDDGPAVAEVFLASRRTFLADVPLVHDDADVHRFFAGLVTDACAGHGEVWVAEASAPVGFAAVRHGWLDHLYLAPGWTGRGIGERLLAVARQRSADGLQLWTFASNTGARRFYERAGFTVEEATDGSGNEEHTPDVRYAWRP